MYYALLYCVVYGDIFMFQPELDEVKETVGRAFKAAIFSMDYSILRVILDASKEIEKACENNDYQLARYSSNKCFWDIGVCIQNKISSYSSISPGFFEGISLNIRKYLKIDSKLAFVPENLMRCFKLAELASEDWFDKVAGLFSWEQFVEALDKSKSLAELEACFGLK